MPHIHWVARQNKLEIPRDKDEVNKREIHEGKLVFPRNFCVYYESIKRKLKIKCMYECRCYERLQTKTKEFTCLVYTGLVVKLEHLEIKLRSTSEEFAKAMGERTIQTQTQC